MSIRTLIVVPVASVVGYFLIFFAVPEGSSVVGGETSFVHRSIMVAGFLLASPTIPFTLLFDVLFRPTWAAVYSSAIGTMISAFFWSIVLSQARRWFIRAKA